MPPPCSEQSRQTISVPGAESSVGYHELQFTPKSARSVAALKTQAKIQREQNKLKYPLQAIKMSTVSMSAR
jgi:hypothetical protein